MTPAPATFDLHATVHQIVPHVFKTMLSLTARPAPPDAADAPWRDERVSGTLGLAGEMLSGAVYLHLSEPLARRATAAMLGLEAADTADPSAVNDVAGELTNILGGSLKSALCDAGQPCAISTPSIVRGRAFAIELPPGLRAENFAFDCEGERLVVEVHLQLN